MEVYILWLFTENKFSFLYPLLVELKSIRRKVRNKWKEVFPTP